MGQGFQDETDVEETAGGYWGLYWGQVTNNQDDRLMGRVKAKVTGITAVETDWAFPIGMPGGGYPSTTGGKGGFYVPRKGATVLVGFMHGKVEEPYYFCAHYPLDLKTKATCVPQIVAQQTKAEAPNVRVIQETETFEIYILDTATEQKIVLQTLGGNTMIELDGKDGSIKLKALKSIVIEAPGVQIDGVGVTIKNRPVSPLGLAI